MQIYISECYVILLWAQRNVENDQGGKLLLTTSKTNTLTFIIINKSY